MYHGLRFYLSQSITIHTNDMWYLVRVIDNDFTHTREVVLAQLAHNCSASVGVCMHVKLVFLEDVV